MIQLIALAAEQTLTRSAEMPLAHSRRATESLASTRPAVNDTTYTSHRRGNSSVRLFVWPNNAMCSASIDTENSRCTRCRSWRRRDILPPSCRAVSNLTDVLGYCQADQYCGLSPSAYCVHLARASSLRPRREDDAARQYSRRRVKRQQWAYFDRLNNTERLADACKLDDVRQRALHRINVCYQPP